MKQSKWTADEKLAIVMKGLKEKKSIADICREHKISQTLHYKWRDRLLEGYRKALDRSASEEEAHRAEVEKLQKIIDKQAIQIEIIKNGGPIREKIEAVKALRTKDFLVKNVRPFRKSYALDRAHHNNYSVLPGQAFKKLPHCSTISISQLFQKIPIVYKNGQMACPGKGGEQLSNLQPLCHIALIDHMMKRHPIHGNTQLPGHALDCLKRRVQGIFANIYEFV